MMKVINLVGEWQLRQDGGEPIPGRLPGCMYLDYMASGMADPFWGENETEANQLAHHNYRYSRDFELRAEDLQAEHLELVGDGLDTLCTITINGKQVAKTNNINRVWRIDVKDACRTGTNHIDIDIADPYAYKDAMEQTDSLPLPYMPESGVAHLRKTPCHFGWDWGPKLPPAGVARSITLEAYTARIEDVRIKQEHNNGAVTLQIYANLTAFPKAASLTGRLKLTGPDGEAKEYPAVVTATQMSWEVVIKDPQLWWCNGLGAQPLYHIDITATLDGETVDTQHRQIGLRTIALDTSKDEHGRQFRFVINGVPIFIKGADWIPPDSFITRFTREEMFFYAETAKRANMNMLRVWGGGMYENENFYDACDANGILVWQDFCFACNPYPTHRPEFLENVRAEVVDNVRRIRHRASLAVWCGNNENEVFGSLAKLYTGDYPQPDSAVDFADNLLFYHNTLRQWTMELDGTTPYWPGSPSTGSLARKALHFDDSDVRGDTHLWRVWHGMMPIEDFRDVPTRFCSEFGMESLPSMHTIRTFTDDPSPELLGPVMQLHQKSGGGNEKMIWYMLAKYRNPAKFEDFVYLSQIVQANTIRFATDNWRRKMGFSNGAIYWQMNDCWPVASWAGIDYEKQPKAVMYHARHFNKMLCLSNDYYDDRAEIYITNDYPTPFSGHLEWSVMDFAGEAINSGSCDVCIGGVMSQNAQVLKFADILQGKAKENAALQVRLVRDSEVLDEKLWLLVPDKNANLPKVHVEAQCSVSGNTASVTLRPTGYARYVYLEAKGVTAPWSDNFFDIPAAETVTVTVQLPAGMSIEEFRQRLRIKTLMDVKPKGSIEDDKKLSDEMYALNESGLQLMEMLANE